MSSRPWNQPPKSVASSETGTASGTTSYSPFTSYAYTNTTTARSTYGRQSRGRPGTGRPRTAVSTLGVESQQIICAVSESRGISPTVGLAFVNLDTAEAVMSQICDNQSYIRTLHKMAVFSPSQILIADTSVNPKSKLFSIIEEDLEQLNSNIVLVSRRYWAETTGLEYIEQLAFGPDLESIKISISANYFAVCCFSAVLKYTELSLGKTFPFHSLRIKYETSEGSMMIELSTIRSLELNQNLQDPKSKECLFGHLNSTLTPMGCRLLRSNILQPITESSKLALRYDAVEELATKEGMFFATRAALKPILDADKIITTLVLVPTQATLSSTEQAVNSVIMLKQFIVTIKPVFEALAGARSKLLKDIHKICRPAVVDSLQQLIDSVINEDTTYASQPIDLRHQRTYAVRSGVNGLLDVARQTYKEATTDVYQLIEDLARQHDIALQACFDNSRQFYIRFPASDLDDRSVPAEFVHVFRKKKNVECQTIELLKRNQKILDSHTEVLIMSDKATQGLIEELRGHASALFKLAEAIGMLDMLASFAQLVTVQEYVRPQITDTLGVQAGRHPIREKAHAKFIPNDMYATQQTRFQIITGCNMSGKSTYIRSVALICVMAQVGSFVPAQFAALPIIKQLFARVSNDDSVDGNVSTFSAEMREMAFILRNVARDSLVIIDELGRGTSTRDGLAIAIAVAEALVQSRALVWFATHFRDLAHIMSERNGVVNKHLAVDMSNAENMTMLYRLTEGVVTEESYGLQLAKVLPLPNDVLETASLIAAELRKQSEKRKKTSLTVIHARRRRLVLNLREQLTQARDGAMDGPVLKSWLKQLQQEFVIRMVAIEDEARETTESEMDDETVDSVSGEGSPGVDRMDIGQSGSNVAASSTGR